MANTRLVYWPGTASFVLGAVGLLLFFLPVLGIPLSSTGLAVGLIALLAAIFVRGRACGCRRWGLRFQFWPWEST